jgi:hypothetical protein
MRTGDLASVDEKSLFVGRFKRNVFSQSYLGGIFTAGDPARGQSGQTYGADIRPATSRFLGRSLTRPQRLCFATPTPRRQLGSQRHVIRAELQARGSGSRRFI